MKMKKAGILVLTAILCVSLVLAGCNNSNDKSAPSASSSGSAESSAATSSPAAAKELSGELKVVHFMEQQWSEQFNAAVSDYVALHPKVKIDLQALPYENYETALKTQFIGGIGPDVAIIEPPMLNALNGIKATMTINEYLDQPNPYSDSGKPWKSDFVDPYVDTSRDPAGNLQLLPWSMVWVGMFYNKDVFAKVGIDSPPATWDEFMATNQKLLESNYTPLYMATKDDGQPWWLFQTMLNALLRPKTEQINLRHKDGWQFDPNNPLSTVGESNTVDELYVAFKKGIIDPAKSPEYRKAVELMLQMKPFLNKNLLSAAGSEGTPKFVSQESIIMPNGSFNLGIEEDIKKLKDSGKSFAWDTFNLPTVTPDNYADLTAGGTNPLVGVRNGWIISNTTKNKELAVDFLQFLTSKEEVSKIYQIERTLGLNGLNGDPSAVANVTYSPNAKKIDITQKHAEIPIWGFGLPPIFDTAQDLSEFQAQWQGLWAGALSVDEFLEKRSASNLAALERNMNTFKDQVDQEFIDEQLK